MPLLRLKNRFETPPGYFRYPRNPDEPLSSDPKKYIIGGDIEDLVKKVTEYRILNRMELGNPTADVEDWLCRNSGAQCVPANPAKPEPGRQARAGDVVRFLAAMKEWMKNSTVVSQEEADRRAELCAGCRFNVNLDDGNCLGCFGLASRIMQVIGDMHTRFDDTIKYCGVCGCNLSITAFAPLDVLNMAHRNSDMPEDTGQRDAEGNVIPCWRRPK